MPRATEGVRAESTQAPPRSKGGISRFPAGRPSVKKTEVQTVRRQAGKTNPVCLERKTRANSRMNWSRIFAHSFLSKVVDLNSSGRNYSITYFSVD